jgi:hypothetical protein
MNRINLIRLAALALVFLSIATSRAQIPTGGLVLRLEGDTGVEELIGDSAENGDPVVRWLDQSSAANHVVTNAPIATDTPTYRTGIANGHAAVEFGIDRDTERLQASTPLLTGSTDFAIFAVINLERLVGARYITGNYGLGNGGGLEFFVQNGKLGLYNLGGFSGSATLATNTWYLVEAEKSGGTYTLRVNDGFDGSSTALGGSIGSGRNWTVGNGPDYNSETFYGDVAAVLVYNTALSAEDRESVIAYLGSTYAVPEPSVVALLGFGALVVLWRWRE